MTTEKNPQIFRVGPRIADFLREAYPKHHAKRIARDFAVSPKTAERWLAGRAPTVPHLEAMASLWGEPFIAAVFGEAYRRRIAVLEAELERVRREVPHLCTPKEELEVLILSSDTLASVRDLPPHVHGLPPHLLRMIGELAIEVSPSEYAASSMLEPEWDQRTWLRRWFDWLVY